MSKHPCFVAHSPSRGQGFLGAAISVTIVGAILLYYTNAVASPCRADVKSGACSGLAAAAHHIQGPLSICVIASVAVFAITFIRSLLS
jgi:hypothetical protein